jgi:precorrin-6B methylase 1
LPDEQESELSAKRSGSLWVVGTGIQLMGQVTLETESVIRSASKLLYLVTDPVTRGWLAELNDSAEDLFPLYGEGKPRIQTYSEMVQRILAFVRAGEEVCVAFYGHPGVFVHPGHEAIRLARAEGYRATMLPGISAEDCLFADLGLDPGATGCQSFEATDFLVYSRRFDEHVPLVLWQVSVIGQLTHEVENSIVGLEVLASHLAAVYGPDHEAVIYEAARYPVCPPVMRAVRIEDLPKAPLSGISTLVVLPRSPTTADMAMVKRLGIPDAYVVKKSERSTPAIPRTAQGERGPSTAPGHPEDDESTAVDPATL